MQVYGMTVNIHVKRHSGYYLVTVVLPIMVRRPLPSPCRSVMTFCPLQIP